MARLPQPGGDEGSWGDILNQYLLAAHSNDGSLKPGSVTTASLQNGVVTEAKLASSVQAKLNQTTTGTVTSVNGKSGAVALGAADVGAATAMQGAAASSAVQPGDLAPVATSGAYTDLTGRPTIPAAQVSSDWNATTGVAQILNKPTIFSGNYADLAGKPTLFSGKYDDLTGKPALFSGSYTDLTDKPTIPAQFNPAAGTNVTLTGTYPDITISATPGAGVTDLATTTTATTVTVESSTGTDATIASATSSNAGILTASDKSKLDGIASGAEVNVQADWNATTGDAQILNKPSLFSGAYADLTGKPTLFSGKYDDLTDKPTLFSGSYTDLSNKPTIPAAQVSSDWNATSGVTQILNKPTLGTAAAAATSDFATAVQGTKADSALQASDLSKVTTPITSSADISIVDSITSPTVTRWKRSAADGTLSRNGVALNDSIVLGASDPVPANLPAGTIIIRTS